MGQKRSFSPGLVCSSKGLTRPSSNRQFKTFEGSRLSLKALQRGICFVRLLSTQLLSCDIQIEPGTGCGDSSRFAFLFSFMADPSIMLGT